MGNVPALWWFRQSQLHGMFWIRSANMQRVRWILQDTALSEMHWFGANALPFMPGRKSDTRCLWRKRAGMA